MVPGIFAKTFARATVEDVFAAVARLRLRCVQFNFACAGLPSLPDAIDPALPLRIRRAADDCKISLAAVSATFNMIHPDSARRRDGLRKLQVIAGACTALGARVMTLCTGTRDPDDMWRAHPANDTPEAWRDLRATLTKALTTAARHDLILAIEPETANVVASARHARRLLDDMRSPRLKIILDPANLFHPGDLGRQREIMEEAFDLLGNDLVLAHAKEISPTGTAGGCALGTGSLDWDGYLTLLHRVRFAGPIIMHGFEERDAAASVKFLKEKVGRGASAVA
jgi:sugar phosphate isomerase/epimerase